MKLRAVLIGIALVAAMAGCASTRQERRPAEAPAVPHLAVEPEEAPPAKTHEFIWRIGSADNSAAEFALAPGNYNGYSEDPIFAVGHSDPKKHWPYAHPGPLDAWAGSRQHTFTVVFGVKNLPPEKGCRLTIDFVDTHHARPPKLLFDINGTTFTRQVPAGASDKSIGGDYTAGREHLMTVEIPPGTIRNGENEISIANADGSWVIYDCIGLEAPLGTEEAPVCATVVRNVRSVNALVERQGRLCQQVKARIGHFGEPMEAELQAGDTLTTVSLKQGVQTVDLDVPEVRCETEIEVRLRVASKTIASRRVILKPVRKWVVYLLPHSHVDIGYTKVQTEVEHDHWRFYEQAIEACRKTRDLPPDARFKWNVEVLWAVDSYLKQASEEKRREFVDAVKTGWIGLDALYGNELTALCRPEELVQLVEFANRLSAQYGVSIDSAMISDVPGYTWGIVPVLAQSGVKYLSIGPNGGARIGYTLSAWADRPFYWVSPCGKHKVLCWIPTRGYWRALRGEQALLDYLQRLETSGYRYAFVQIRHCLGDNAGPAVDLSEFVGDWNSRYAYPRLVISTTSRMFHDFEQRYGDAVPTVRGDFTPYWEDGAASSARETAQNRTAAEGLVQAEILWTMLKPTPFPGDRFYEAWRNTLLYDEHTWGAHCSISQPDSDFTKAQWKIKQAFALDAEAQSQQLLQEAVAAHKSTTKPIAALDVFNTCSWERTDLVVVAQDTELAGDRVEDTDGNAVASQRLSSGGLVFLAQRVPPLAAKRFLIKAGSASGSGNAKAEDLSLANRSLSLALNPETGAIAELRIAGMDRNLVDASGGHGLNHYLYVAGKDPKSAAGCGSVSIRTGERGPLVASLVVESEAPGCDKLTRELRVVDGSGRIDIINTVDKRMVREKEGVHFAFPFNVPEGVVRMDVPWAVVRPEADQMPGACKNWFTVQRWIDVSNQDFGVTWATLDAPLVEVGAITAETPWIAHIEPSTTFYSYVMNNYWFTNYRASQQGPTVFRYSISPHQERFRPGEAARFGVECSQPLIAVPVDAGSATPGGPFLSIEPDDVILTALRPSRDGKALIVRLFNAGGAPVEAAMHLPETAKASVWMSDLSEAEGAEVDIPFKMLPFEIVTLRVLMR